MSGALDGIRVIDFGQYVAGPLVAELLAQNGAEVVHIDPPGGPRLDGLPDAYLNRGKRRTVLDLHRKRDLETARRLCAGADVVVENFRPGVMARLGLGSADLTATDPGLVYCSLPGFAASDPRSSLPAWEGLVLSATAGYRRLHGHWDWKARIHNEVDDQSRPLFTALPIASNTAALLAALRIVSALYRRERTGRGAVLEVPLAEAMLEVVGFHLEMPDFVGPREDLPKAFLGSFRCSDGRYFDQVPYPRFVRKLLEAAGEWDAWCADGLSDLSRVFFDPEVKYVADRRFADLISTRPAEYWEKLVLEHGSSAVQVRTPQEWLNNEHARQSRTVVGVEDPEFGRLLMAGTALDLSETPTSIVPRSLPDGDADEVLALPARPARTAATATGREEAPLAGVSVLEFSQVVAGPITGRLLADLGAEVVKIANPAPDGNNGFHGSYTNRGKQTALLNLQDPDELATVRAAAAASDVLLQNYAYGAIERYGLSYDELQAERGDLVYVSMGAYSRSGPWSHRRGHENQAVAVTGLSTRYGGDGGWPVYQPYLICDVGTGIMGAFAAALGLYHRARTGTGQHISTSLTHLATLHQGIYLFAGDNVAARLPEPSGLDARGWSSLQRLYRAADGWLFLAAAPDQRQALLESLFIDDPGEDPINDLGDRIGAVLGQHTRSHWVALLADRGIAAQPVRDIEDVANDPLWHDRRVLRHSLNGEGKVSPVLGVGSPPWPVPEHVLDHPGPLGAHTTIVRNRYRDAASIGK
jgi:crotonobetainyl-CoA:carnitine CoA-transferase CaiB-like acyl-CoA transferase